MFAVIAVVTPMAMEAGAETCRVKLFVTVMDAEFCLVGSAALTAVIKTLVEFGRIIGAM